MKSELVAGAGLENFAIVGLLIFVAVFIGILIWLFTGKKRNYEKWSHLPLDEGDQVSGVEGEGEKGK